MGKFIRVSLFTFGVCGLLVSRAFPEEVSCRLEKIVITPSRIPTPESQRYRSVATITGDDIETSSYTAVQDIIGGLGAIDLRRRAPEGVQADVTIRGSTFEQSQVLLDGIKMNDPQTGHHNMDIPITKFDLERIDILKGPGSSAYGANAFGGIIHFVTRKPEENKVVVESSGGSYDFFSGGFSMDNALKNFKNRVSFQEDRSTGYRPETEFNSITVSEHAYLETPFGSHSLLFGYARKDFGADSFYSNRFDNEEEHTDTRFIKVDSDFKDGDLVMKPVLFLRRHRDKFALDRNRPGWQTNYHTTYNYGGEVGFLQHSEFADVACGFELSQETIDSTNMQQHRRTKDGVYVELNPKLAEKLLLNIGFREDRYDDFGWEYSPSLGASYRLWDHYKIRSSAGRSFRVPTFTDLYYRDSGNVGRSDLRPETSWSYEVGLDYDARGLSLKTTVFRREVNDTIDWTRSDTRSAWQAKNIGTVDTNGLEIGLDIDLRATMKGMPLERAFVNYTALDSYFKHEYLSKYASDYLKQHISGGLRVELPYGVKNSWVINYKKRVGDSGFIVVDAHLSKEILKEKKMTCEAFVDVTNIFDAIYSEQSDLDMPGRWIKSGARMRF